ncbi:trigger factor [bacterium J17]|nr:trigger factor [bacterium J17]
MDYKISVEEKSEVVRSISIEVPSEHYDKKFDQKLRAVTGSANIKGFRPGRAPRAIVAKMYGEKIHFDLVGEFAQAGYAEAVKEHSLKVVGDPLVNVDDHEKGEDLKIIADVDIFPEPELKDYFGVQFEAPVSKVSEEEIDKSIEELRASHAIVEKVEDRDVSQSGDLVVADVVALKDGQPNEQSKHEDFEIELGAEKGSKEIEEGLTGLKIGESRVVDIESPRPPASEAGGEEQTEETEKFQYQVTLKEIKTKTLPELNDQFAKETGIADDLDGLKKHVKESLESRVEEYNNRSKQDKYFEQLFKKNKFEVPQSMIDNEIRSMLFEMGMLDPKDPRANEIDISRFREHFGDRAQFQVRRVVALGRIVEQEGFSVDDEQLETWLNEIAEKNNATREQVNQFVGFPENVDRLKDSLAREKMMEQLLEKAKIKEVVEEAKK